MSFVSTSLSLIKHPHILVRWAAGGWTFFVIENAILSENRTWLIDSLGDDNYHLCYGVCSTIATASIGLAYYKISRKTPPIPPQLVRRIPKNVMITASNIGSWISMSVGLIMASQVAPTFQIPVSYSSPESGNTTTTDVVTGPTNENDINSNNQSSGGGMKFQVRCPFDFADKRLEKSDESDFSIRGLERISRHPGLWSFGLIGLSQSFLAPTIPLQIWWLGPAFVAWMGGNHTDSRFRRGIGGTLPPQYECQTSNIPFLAMITGKQHGGFEALGNEIKPLNAVLAVAASSMWILRRIKR